MEQYYNLVTDTASGTIAATGTPVTIVVGTGSNFPNPTNGPFRITVVGTDGSNPEVMIVYAQTTNTLTAARGTAIPTYGAAELPTPTLSTHTASSIVSLNWTTGAMNQIAKDLNGYGSIANRPSAPLQVGARYVASDSVFDEARWNGSSYDQFVAGMKCVPPATTVFGTGVQGANGTEVSFANANDGLIWQGQASSGNNCIIRVGTVPSTPYRMRLRFRHNHTSDAYEYAGICLWNGTTALTWGVGLRDNAGVGPLLYEWTGPLTTPSIVVGNALGLAPTWRGGVYDLWVGDDSTNLNYYICQDGQNPVQVYQAAHHATITPTYLGIAMLPYTQTFSPSSVMTILDWSSV